ncbi:MAG TPA: four helix bundle protein [Chitinophagaceae bacterium]|jgi:four helix bundle protein|nr:four helix bundle protein [Chitinophagaceae bacterium]
MPFKFESLHIWQKAFALTDEIHALAFKFPKTELFNLSSQIRRASDSVVLNICEGSTGQSSKEYRKFLNYSLRSAIEVVGCLMLAKKRNHIHDEIFKKLYEEYDHLCRMITKFRDLLHSDR